MMKTYLSIVAAAGLTACMDSKAPTPETRLTVNVAPLALAGIDDACYGLEVFSGTTAGTRVWEKEHICSRAFGDGKGSLAYVGTCDASGTGASTVRLTLEDLCAGGACGPTTSLPASDWRNPCPAPDGCTLPATCVANGDVPVTFNLTIARSANQGFFDVAVSFDDIFCSAKADCQQPDGSPLELLHDPADSTRKQTAVVAFACTAGPGADTWLYYDNLVLACYDGADQPIGEWAYDPSLGPGNIGPGSAPFVFQAATYRTVDADNGVASWNVAFGIDTTKLPGRCVIRARATASDGPFADFTTTAGAVYPYLSWEVPLSSGVDTLSCGRHQLNVPGSGVTTEYASAKTFSHGFRASTQLIERRGAQSCAATIEELDDQVTFTVSPEGLTARVGGSQSPFYPLPAGVQLSGCCGDPCCE